MYEEKSESPINFLRPLPGQPPVLNEAERKLEDIKAVYAGWNEGRCGNESALQQITDILSR